MVAQLADAQTGSHPHETRPVDALEGTAKANGYQAASPSGV
jgi:hypothetical protein